MARHGDESGFALGVQNSFYTVNGVGHWNFDLHMLAGPHRLQPVLNMKRRRRGQDHTVHIRVQQPLFVPRTPPWDTEWLGELVRTFVGHVHDPQHFYALDTLERLEVAFRMRPRADHEQIHCVHIRSFKFNYSPEIALIIAFLS